MKVRTTKRVDGIEVLDFGRPRTVSIAEGVLCDVVHEITVDGNAVVGLAFDEPTTIPAGSYEIVPEHRTVVVVENGKNHVECLCSWRQSENRDHPEPIAALRKSGQTHVRYAERIRS